MEITIIKEEDRSLTEEEKKIIYKKNSDELKIPYIYFEEFIKLENDTTTKELNNIKPEILILLIKRILSYANVIPIISSLPNQTDKNNSNLQKVVLLQDLEKFHKTNKYYIIQENESVEILGLIIKKDQINEYFVDQITNINLIDRIKSGAYSEEYLWNRIFIPNKLESNILSDYLLRLTKTDLVVKDNLFYILFKQDSKIYDLLFIYMNYLSKPSGDYVNKYLNLLLNAKNATKIELENQYGDLYNNLLDEMKISTLEETIIPKTKKNPQLELIKNALIEIEKIPTLGKYSYEFSDSIWFDLINDNLLIVLEKEIMTLGDITNEQKNQYEKDIEKILFRKKSIIIMNVHTKIQNIEHQKKVIKEMIYRWLYIKKFGFEKYKKKIGISAYHTMKSAVPETKGRILQNIPDSEKKIIKTDFINYEKEKEYKAPWQLQPWRRPVFCSIRGSWQKMRHGCAPASPVSAFPSGCI